MVTINHEIVVTDSKGFAKQQMNLTHQEYLSLVDQLTENIEIEEKPEDLNNYLTNLVFGRIKVNEQ